MNNICPICNQAGLADYRTEHIVCPQCNSDLKPYLLLNRISKIKNKQRANRFILCGLTISCLIFFFLLSKNASSYHQYKIDSIRNIQLLQDSITAYKKNEIDNRITGTGEFTISHKIKRGDSLWKIANRYYGNGKLYKKIEEDNQLRKPYALKAGQMLNIKYSSNEWN